MKAEHFLTLGRGGIRDGQLSCYMTYTNEEVHEELRKGLEFSPLYTGRILGIGPRYCPSIETKIVTFSEKISHQLFVNLKAEYY